MNKTKIIFGSVVFLGIFLLSYDFSLASGCCIKDTNVNGASNCKEVANKAACTGVFQDNNSCSGLSMWCSNDSSGKATASEDVVKKTTAAPASVNTPTSGGATLFTNPLNYTNVEDLLTGILSAIQKIIVVLALVFITIGAVMILVSAGSPETVEKGKKAITMAIVGLAIGIAAPSILKELAGILGWGTTNASVTAAMSLSTIALNVLNFLLGITGVLALIMLIVGAVMYLTSAGDEERIESGKKIFKNALIGILIVMASMVLVRQIALFFVAG